MVTRAQKRRTVAEGNKKGPRAANQIWGHVHLLHIYIYIYMYTHNYLHIYIIIIYITPLYYVF